MDLIFLSLWVFSLLFHIITNNHGEVGETTGERKCQLSIIRRWFWRSSVVHPSISIGLEATSMLSYVLHSSRNQQATTPFWCFLRDYSKNILTCGQVLEAVVKVCSSGDLLLGWRVNYFYI